MSMGGANAFSYERFFPGAAAIMTASGSVSMSATNPGNPPLSSADAMSFGPLYVALQTSTNQDPSSISGYWKQISAAASFAPEAYFQSPQYRFAYSGTGLWTNTDTYNPGDIIGMAMTGNYDQLTAFDVPTNAATFSHVPVYLATCSNGSDPVIDAENTAAYNALSAVNPNVSIARVTTTCSRIGASLRGGELDRMG